MGTMKKIAMLCALVALGAVVIAGCDPADRLSNQEYRPYLDNYQKWQISDVVTTFNELETKREAFDCQDELEKAHLARWREKAGQVKVDQTPAGEALMKCLQEFRESAGIGGGTLRGGVLMHWMNHNFLPPAEKRLEAMIQADQERLGEAGCGGDQCQVLVVVGDVATQRAGQKVAVAWQDARSMCSAADYGGLSPWRLPTREELAAMRESGKLATDQDTATYWSSTREFDDQGNLKAYVLRFDLESLGQDIEPRAIGFDREGVPTVAKVRCVYDLGKAPEPTGAVAEMEKAVLAAGCPRNWEEKVRVRGDLMVTWEKVVKSGENARDVCRDLGWCGLTWRSPSRREAKQLSEDPWIGSTLDSRCIADLPEKSD